MGEASRHRHSRPSLWQPFFDWNAPDKYVELLSFEMEVMNILQTKTYELNDEEKVPVIKKLEKEGLQLIQTFTNPEKEAPKMAGGLFVTLDEKFKQQHNETIWSLQYCKLKRKGLQYAQEWMGRLSIQATECKYQEYERRHS